MNGKVERDDPWFSNCATFVELMDGATGQTTWTESLLIGTVSVSPTKQVTFPKRFNPKPENVIRYPPNDEPEVGVSENTIL
jgi:hypothetical protein